MTKQYLLKTILERHPNTRFCVHCRKLFQILLLRTDDGGNEHHNYQATGGCCPFCGKGLSINFDKPLGELEMAALKRHSHLMENGEIWSPLEEKDKFLND
jgi:hypothetical protein